jgi:hypothetical protein
VREENLAEDDVRVENVEGYKTRNRRMSQVFRLTTGEESCSSPDHRSSTESARILRLVQSDFHSHVLSCVDEAEEGTPPKKG